MRGNPTPFEGFTAIIGAWPSITALAEDLGEQPELIRQWKRRDTIPARAWKRLVQAAERRDIPGVTLERLAELADGGVAADQTEPQPAADAA